ncbi:hypothetical protein [Lysobacter gummosus]|uniref:hypothetical protein n=1 Tax=Lysobacter gummosus TaxID=262324 RepID=UPI0036386C33
MSIKRKVAWSIGTIILAVLAYLCFWPVPADPRAWVAPLTQGYAGVFAKNTRLANLQTVELRGNTVPSTSR